MYYLDTKTPVINFTKVLRQKIYVDKSALIEPLNELLGTSESYFCITRPRRFGKTINANMLAAYYTKGYDSHALFDGLNIASARTYQQNLNQHHVIFIDFSQMPDICRNYTDYISSIRKKISSDLKEAYPFLQNQEFDSIHQMLRASGDSFVFILDEWDSVFYKSIFTEHDRAEYLQFLKSLLKDQPYVELAYMTGVLPIAKYSSGSELNMFREYHFMNDHVYERFFGMTEVEVKALCETHKNISFEQLKYWYDGYHLSDGGSLFNPRSVNCALSDGVCLNYWTETGPMNEIADCIEHNVDEVREDIVKMIAGIPVEIDLQGYSASELQMDTRDEILSAMVVYGFLSYYDGCLSIPNHELMEKFQRVLSRESMGGIREIVASSKDMLKATLDCNSEKVASILEKRHSCKIEEWKREGM